jgi:nucleoside-diphosphate-sugar epimerase
LTGATGFVGSHVAEALLSRGDDLTCLARRPERLAALAARGARVVEGSLEDAPALAAALAGAEAVYHVAGVTAAPDEAEYLAVNEGGTRRLLEAAGRTAPGSRFVYVSSQAAVGPSAPGERTAEDAPCRPVTAYGRSKLAGERAVMESDLGWVIVRPPAVYGPRDREFLRLFRLVRRGLAPVFGFGRQELSLVYAEDLARAVALAGVAGRTGQIYHAAHPEVVLARHVPYAMGRALSRSPFLIPVPARLAAPIVRAIGRRAAARGRRTVVSEDKLAEFLAPSWVLSAAKAERELGWRAAHDLASGMRKTAEWYRAEGWLS